MAALRLNFSTILIVVSMTTLSGADIQMENGITLHTIEIEIVQPAVVILARSNPLQLNVSVNHITGQLRANQSAEFENLTDVTWRLSIWGSNSMEPNGTRISFTGQALDSNQRAQPLIPDSPLHFDPVVDYKLDLRQASCSQGAQYICAELVRKPGENFTANGSLETCIRGPSCKDGVVVNDLDIAMNQSLEVEVGKLYKLRLDVSIVYDRNLTSDVTGVDLWRLMIWVRGLEGDFNDTSQRLLLVEQALTQQQSDQSLISGEEFYFENVAYTLDMRNITCEEAELICVRFRQGENRTYELLSKPNASVRTKCVRVLDCLDVEEIFVTEYLTTEDMMTSSEISDVLTNSEMMVAASTPLSLSSLSTSFMPSHTTPSELFTEASAHFLTTTHAHIHTHSTDTTFYQWLSDVITHDVSEPSTTGQSADTISAELVDWTEELDDVSGVELSMTGEVIAKISRLEDVSRETANNVVEAVDHIISLDSASSSSSTSHPNPSVTPHPHLEGRSQTQFVQSLERLLAHVKLDPNSNSSASTFSKSGVNLAMAAFNVGVTNSVSDADDFYFLDDRVQIYVKEEFHFENGSDEARKLVFNKISNFGADLKDADVAVEFETGKLLNSAIDPPGSLRIDLIVYRNDTLFSTAASTATSDRSHGDPSSSGSSRDGCSIESKVLSVSIRRDDEEMSKLASPINMTFRIKKNNPSYTPTCTYWDFDLNDGLGDWSTLGCDLVDETDDQAVCSCDHLTNFAVLMAPSYGCHPYALDILSQVGCVVSTLGLVITIITYIMFGKPMGQTPRLIMIQWCVSLLCLYLVFVIGIDQTRAPGVCTAVAALLHYFTLSSVLWMGVEGANLYILLVRVMDVPRTRRFMPPACLIAWGVPVGFVFLGFFQAGPDRYREQSFCFLSRDAHFIYALLLPLAAVLLANIVCYIMVMRTLTCSRMKIRVTKMEKGKLHDLATRLQQALAIGMLTGLTWLFGFFAIGQMAAVFTWLFCICNSLQGVCVFLLFCVFRPELRRSWKKLLCPKTIRPKRRATPKSSELDQIPRSRSTSLRETYSRSISASSGHHKGVATYKDYSASTSFNRTLSG